MEKTNNRIQVITTALLSAILATGAALSAGASRGLAGTPVLQTLQSPTEARTGTIPGVFPDGRG